MQQSDRTLLTANLSIRLNPLLTSAVLLILTADVALLLEELFAADLAARVAFVQSLKARRAMVRERLAFVRLSHRVDESKRLR